MLIIRENILVLGEGPPQGLDDATIMAEAKYSINFSRSQTKFCLGLHYRMESTVFLFVNTLKIYQFKAKTLKQKNSHCIYQIFQRFFTQHDKAGWNGIVYNFSVDYRAFNIVVLPIFRNI